MPAIRRKRRKNAPSASLFELLAMTFLGRVVLVALVAILVLGVSLLITGDDLDRFLPVVGVEILVALGAYGAVYLVRRTRSS